MKLLAIAVLVLLPSWAAAQQPAALMEPRTQEFARIDRIGDDKFRSFFTFKALGYDFTIRGDGYTEAAGGKGRPHYFNLKVDRAVLMQVYLLEYEGDLLLMYEVGNARQGWGYVERRAQGTLKLKWIAGISGYNIGPAIVEDDALYMTSAGQVARLDLRNGAYAWQVDRLNEKYAPSFQLFNIPAIRGDQVWFTEDPDPHKTVVIEKLTGKVLEVRTQDRR
jgi:hypothetical protein